MDILTYRALLSNNEASFNKAGLDKPIFGIDWADGMASGVTLAACSYSAVTSANADITAQCISGVTTTGTVTTVSMVTCSTGGTAAATDGDRFRLRILQTLSDSRVCNFDAFVIIQNPAYAP